MSDAIGWSYDLLTPAEQSLFLLLAAVPGIRTERMAQRASSTLDLSSTRIGVGLASLADHNLLQRQAAIDGEEGFQMLYTVRAFGLEQARRQLPVASCQLPVASCQLPVASKRHLAD